MNQLLPSFNAGELSPRLSSRPNIEKYGSGCRTLQNFLLMPYGGVNRRPGFVYMGAAKNANKKARLIGFNFSVTTNFVLEFGDGYVRFWSNGQQVLSGGSPYEIASPYAEAHLFECQYVQINDVMYIAHPSYPVYKLSRFADTNWTLAEVAWDYPALRSRNTGTTTITPSGTSGAITLTASSAIFAAASVGGYYEVAHRRQTTASLQQTLTASGTSASMRVIGKWDFRTAGTWAGTVEIQRSYDNATWETISAYTAASDRNITTNGNESAEAYLRIKHTWASSSGTPFAYIDASDTSVCGVVKITGYTSPTVVAATVVKPLESTAATTLWAEGAWSARRGYPRTVALHEQRLWFGGNAAEAQKIWGSAIDDFENFRVLSYDDAALAFSIASTETNAINWMVSQTGSLCVGTAGYEYIVTSGGDGSITPSAVNVKTQTHYGSKYAPAIVCNEVALFVQRQGRKIREFVYQFDKDGYVSPDLTLLADHITEGGITQIAFQQQPDAVLWCVTGAGILAAMTYERSQNVVGWHRHNTDGEFESVAAIYGDNGADELWAIVKRTVNAQPVRYVERMDPDFRDALESEDKLGWLYLDCAKKRTGSPTTSITGLSHLEGKTVAILGDGAVIPSQTVTGGAITLPTAAATVVVGLPYTSLLQPMPLDPGNLQDGTAQGRKMRVDRLILRLYRSLGGEVEVQDGTWDNLYFRDIEGPMDQSPAVFTGDKQITVARSYETQGTVTIRQTAPLPLSILAIIPKYNVYGD